MKPAVGVSFGDRYELQSLIAIGGMGEVWEAVDPVIGRTVAIKILKAEYLGDPTFLERFRFEARHAALVNHEAIAKVFDYGEEQGSAYLVMELVPGEPLSQILGREPILPPDKVLDIVAQTAEALHAAHKQGIVHRDIKPANLLVTPKGRIRITDFGIARLLDQTPLTSTGQVMGTVQYLAPEQADGKPATPASDIYSLGVVAYECLAGERPFSGESQVAVARAHLNDEPPPLPDSIPKPVRDLVFSCLEKDPEQRPRSASELARTAEDLKTTGPERRSPSDSADEEPTKSREESPPTEVTSVVSSQRSAQKPRKSNANAQRIRPRTWVLIALIGIILLLAGALAGILIGGVNHQNAPTSNSPTATARPPAPSSAPTTTDSTVGAQQSISVQWSAATCPSGAMPDNYILSASNGASARNPIPSDQTTATVVAGVEDFSVSYSVVCSGKESGPSPLLHVKVSSRP